MLVLSRCARRSASDVLGFVCLGFFWDLGFAIWDLSAHTLKVSPSARSQAPLLLAQPTVSAATPALTIPTASPPTAPETFTSLTPKTAPFVKLRPTAT